MSKMVKLEGGITEIRMAVDEEIRYRQLKAMHKVIQETNDGNIYFSWVTVGIPDCPTDIDFYDIARNKEEYDEIVDLFIRLVSKRGYRAQGKEKSYGKDYKRFMVTEEWFQCGR